MRTYIMLIHLNDRLLCHKIPDYWISCYLLTNYLDRYKTLYVVRCLSDSISGEIADGMTSKTIVFVKPSKQTILVGQDLHSSLYVVAYVHTTFTVARDTRATSSLTFEQTSCVF